MVKNSIHHCNCSSRSFLSAGGTEKFCFISPKQVHKAHFPPVWLKYFSRETGEGGLARCKKIVFNKLGHFMNWKSFSWSL